MQRMAAGMIFPTKMHTVHDQDAAHAASHRFGAPHYFDWETWMQRMATLLIDGFVTWVEVLGTRFAVVNVGGNLSLSASGTHPLMYQ